MSIKKQKQESIERCSLFYLQSKQKIMKLSKAERHQVKLRVGLSGSSGFGKTYSALLLAHGITNDWNKIALIDTENKSASLYSHLGSFNVLSLEEPFSPERYLKAIKLCEDSDYRINYYRLHKPRMAGQRRLFGSP
jgi:hypothetical protein